MSASAATRSPTGISFDPAVDFYDATRALDGDAAAAVETLLREALGGAGAVAEVGVGTGRVAVPLARHVGRVVGVDMSEKMLAELTAKGAQNVSLLRGDATTLPLRDQSVDGAIACLVLHLLPGWRAAAQEMTRIARGPILVDPGGQQAMAREVHAVVAERAGMARIRQGLDVGSEGELDAVMEAAGRRTVLCPPVVEWRRQSPASVLDDVARRRWSWTWGLTDEALAGAVEATEPWLQQRYRDPAGERWVRWAHQWRAYVPADGAPEGGAGTTSSIDQLRFTVRRGGDDVVVLLHPLGCDGRYWDDVAAGLAGTCTTIVVDLPGHGGSAARIDWDLDLSADLVRIVRSVTAGRVHVVGSSLGAQVALRLAAAEPTVVASLVLSGFDPRPADDATTGFLDGLADAFDPLDGIEAAALYASIFPLGPASGTHRERLDAMVATTGGRGLAEALRSFGRRGAVDIPDGPAVRLVFGADDAITGPALDAAVGLLSPVEVVRPPGGHLLGLDAPEAFVDAVRQALAQGAP